MEEARMTNLRLLCEDTGIDIAEVYFCIGSGIIPAYMVNYSDGDVLVSDEVVDTLCSSWNIIQFTEETMLETVQTIMNIEKKRKATEQSEN
jgi:hypothetical protein